MTVFTEFAPAKINLALHVLARRPDGYHELDSIVAFADVGDVLTFRESGQTSLTIDGPFAAGLSTGPDNLVLKAMAALQAVAAVPHLHVNLTKNIPVASGIGGGSADAAAMLRGLLRITGHVLPIGKLQKIALSLGADVPVCLRGKPCRMQGIGETITDLPPLPWKAVVLANPLQPCNTADVFHHLGLAKGQTHGTAVEWSAPESWRNDLTSPALKTLPEIAGVLAAFAAQKQLMASRMSGSGATCFGLAASIEDAENTAAHLRVRHPHWWIKAAGLLG